MMKNNAAFLVALLLERLLPTSAFSPRLRRNGQEWSPPRPTENAANPEYRDDGMSPVPTEAPRPDFAGVELFRRADYTMGSDTCGFAADYKSEPWTCYKVGASCVSTGTVLGCCAGAEPDCYSTVQTTCQNYRSTVTSCGRNTLCCPSASPACYTWEFSTSKSPGSTYSLFNCYAIGGTGKLVDTPPILTAATSTKPRSSASTSPSGTSTTPSPRLPVGQSTDTTATPQPTSSSSDSNTGSSTNIGAIVGGVVGGVAVLGILIVAVFWLLMRNKRANAKNTVANGDTSIGGGGATATGPGQGKYPDVLPSSSPAQASPAMGSPPMAQQQQGAYFMGAGIGQPQQHGPGGYSLGPNGAYYDPPKQQSSPVYGDPRTSVLQPQHTGGTVMSNSNMSTGYPYPQGYHSPQTPPAATELGVADPAGSKTNPSELQ